MQVEYLFKISVLNNFMPFPWQLATKYELSPNYDFKGLMNGKKLC